MLGGSGPVNKGIDLERFHGVGVEGFQDYGKAGNELPKRPEPGRAVTATTFDPVARVEPIHAEETMGLGTSTFLEGAPASKKAVMQRRESETQISDQGMGGGLGRKKSLAQRFRGGIRGDRPGVRSPELPRYNDSINSSSMPDSPPPPSRAPPIPSREVQSAGGPARIHQGESNPFDNMYDEAYDRKGASITVAERERGSGRARAPSSPMRPLERRVTTDSADGDPENRPAGGFLNRVKSLKGGRRVRRPS
jgi:Pal1 cell morphology protein